jgi:18S rRNA (adenine1779-N6/adenine1780-N6)-dimethyltransferase
VLEMLEHNYKTYCSLQGKDVEMDLDVKKIVMDLLEKTGLGEMRASKMDNDDFLLLLSSFIDAGFRFTAK